MQDLRELYINGFFDGYAFGLEEESALLQTLDIPFYKWCFLGISKDKLDELLEAAKSNRPSVVRRFVEDSFAELKARSDDIDVHLPFGGMDITLVYVHEMLSKLNQYLDKFNGEIAEVYSRIKQGE